MTGRQTFGLVLVGFGALACPLQLAGFYLPFDVPMPVTLAFCSLAGMTGGALMATERRAAAVLGGLAAALGGSLAVLGYLALWSLWSPRTTIYEVELLIPALAAGALGLAIHGLARRLLYRPDDSGDPTADPW